LSKHLRDGLDYSFENAKAHLALLNLNAISTIVITIITINIVTSDTTATTTTTTNSNNNDNIIVIIINNIIVVIVRCFDLIIRVPGICEQSETRAIR
jgi:hypothetical protein